MPNFTITCFRCNKPKRHRLVTIIFDDSDTAHWVCDPDLGGCEGTKTWWERQREPWKEEKAQRKAQRQAIEGLKQWIEEHT